MRARGFTLVEVMVALAVVAIAVPALLVALYQQIDNTGYLRDRTLAQMVASNQLAEMRLSIAAKRELSKQKANGMREFADREWFWRSEIAETEVGGFYRLEVAVAAEEGEKAAPLYTLVGYMSSDVQTAAKIARSQVAGNEGSDPGSDENNGGNNNDGGTGTDPGAGSNGEVLNGLPSDAQQQLIDAIQNSQ